MRAAALLPLALSLAAAVLPSPARADERAFKIPTRAGVTETFAFDLPDQAKAVAILFAGGEGVIDVVGAGGMAVIKRPGNFLIRSRDKFVAHGIATISLDAPSDESSGMSGEFRESADHAQDVAAVIAWARKTIPAPVWLVGTSMGSISAANAASRLAGTFDGLVLTSSVSAPNKNFPGRGSGVLSVALDKIAAPVLVMDHVKDECGASPPENADVIARKLTASPRVEVKMMEGGDSPKSPPCEAFSYHGYLGVEDKAVDAIAQFMLAK
jgi:hypothetical protein